MKAFVAFFVTALSSSPLDFVCLCFNVHPWPKPTPRHTTPPTPTPWRAQSGRGRVLDKVSAALAEDAAHSAGHKGSGPGRWNQIESAGGSDGPEASWTGHGRAFVFRTPKL